MFNSPQVHFLNEDQIVDHIVRSLITPNLSRNFSASSCEEKVSSEQCKTQSQSHPASPVPKATTDVDYTSYSERRRNAQDGSEVISTHNAQLTHKSRGWFTL